MARPGLAGAVKAIFLGVVFKLKVKRQRESPVQLYRRGRRRTSLCRSGAGQGRQPLWHDRAEAALTARGLCSSWIRPVWRLRCTASPAGRMAQIPMRVWCRILPATSMARLRMAAISNAALVTGAELYLKLDSQRCGDCALQLHRRGGWRKSPCGFGAGFGGQPLWHDCEWR